MRLIVLILISVLFANDSQTVEVVNITQNSNSLYI